MGQNREAYKRGGGGGGAIFDPPPHLQKKKKKKEKCLEKIGFRGGGGGGSLIKRLQHSITIEACKSGSASNWDSVQMLQLILNFTKEDSQG